MDAMRMAWPPACAFTSPQPRSLAGAPLIAEALARSKAAWRNACLQAEACKTGCEPQSSALDRFFSCSTWSSVGKRRNASYSSKVLRYLATRASFSRLG